jgi:hypothetical protein
MALTLLGSASHAGSGPLLATSGLGVSDGDKLIAVFYDDQANSSTLSSPGGYWTLAGYIQAGEPFRFAVYTRTATASEPTDYQITTSAFTWCALYVFRDNDFVSFDAVGALGNAFTDTGGVVAPSFTVAANVRVASLTWAESGTNGAYPSGTTGVTLDSAYHVFRTSIATKDIASAGASGTISWPTNAGSATLYYAGNFSYTIAGGGGPNIAAISNYYRMMRNA